LTRQLVSPPAQQMSREDTATEIYDILVVVDIVVKVVCSRESVH